MLKRNFSFKIQNKHEAAEFFKIVSRRESIQNFNFDCEKCIFVFGMRYNFYTFSEKGIKLDFGPDKSAEEFGKDHPLAINLTSF